MIKKILKIICGVIAGILVLILAVAVFAFFSLNGNVKNVKRIDENGSLYYAEYTGDYEHNLLAALPVKIIQKVGCSAFVTYDDQGNVLTGRNYDLPHKDEPGNITGLNVVLECHPEGKYASIGTADAAWISMLGINYCAGALDDGKTTQLPLTFLPYLCMDGINEKGLCASILALDVKEGESAAHQDAAGKDPVMISELLRYTLDTCATVDEAVALAGKYNMIGMLGYDYHLFVSDASGVSAVLEWRFNELTVTYTNASTNFYLGYDDAENVLKKDGTVKEVFNRPSEKTYQYRYGYGHGYDRFNILTEALEEHIVSKDPYRTVMTADEAMDLLEACSQLYDGESVTSFTQYSVVYNNAQLTMEISPMRHYDEKYTFSLNK